MADSMRGRRLRAWNLSTRTVEFAFGNFGILSLAFVVPELARCIFYVVAGRLEAKGVLVPAIVSTAVDSAMDAAIYVFVLSYILNGVRPSLAGLSAQVKPAIIIAAILVPCMVFLRVVTDGSILTGIYVDYLMPGEIVEAELALWLFGFRLLSFCIYVCVVALVFPVFGFIVATGHVHLAKTHRWIVNHWPSLIGTAALLIASLQALKSGYWEAINSVTGGTLHQNLPLDAEADIHRLIAIQLFAVPIDFAFSVIPPIAIGLLHRMLWPYEADL